MSDINFSNLKDQIINELSSGNFDIGKLQSLITELSKLDKDSVAFSVDAALIDRLGRELVQKKETAVAELVKNAYDADSTEVNLIFENTNSPSGTLRIIDNGHGMNYDRFINAFMRISSLDKINNPKSPKYERQKAGRKGIGRFSAQRLGTKLTLITKTKEMEKAIKVEINWDEYEGEKELVGIRHDVQDVSIDDEQGTVMVIENLREKWTQAQIRRVYRYISELIQPYPLSKESKEAENKNDPGFKANFYQVKDGKPQSVIDEETFIFDFALATITAHVDNNGQAYWSIKSDKLGFEESNIKIGSDQDDHSSKFKWLNNINLEAHYFIYLREYIPPQQMTKIRDLASEKGGIRLYRNGFRVLPYAESGDDWLELDRSVRRRQILAPHGNNNFFGFVEIHDPDAEIFEETSSREGLIENDAFDELVDLVHRVLISGVLKVSEVRGSKGSTGQKDWNNKTPKEKLDNASKKIEEIKENIEKSSDGDKESQQRNQESLDKLTEVSDELDSVSSDVEDQLGEIEMLRVLSSLGLIIGEFTHEIRQFLGTLQLKSEHIEKLLTEVPEGQQVAKEFKSQFKSLRDYTSYFDSNVAQSINRELKPIDLNIVITKFEEVIEFDLERSGVGMEIKRGGAELNSIPMHESEWASILFNLYSNSKKAFQRAKVNGKIKIEIGREEEKVYLEFSDNGNGIPEENRDKIFNPFFTTSSPAGPTATGYDDILGSGLGLKIIQDIVSSYNGKIELVESPDNFSTTFRISVPYNKSQED